MNGERDQSRDETGVGNRGGTSRRGQSEVISVILLLAIVVLSVTAVVASGTAVIEQTRDRAEIGAAERAIAAYDSDMSTVAFGQSETQTTDLGLDANDGEMRYDDSGWLRVSVDSEASGPDVVVNESLGAVQYQKGDTTVAAQGGGVWRSDGDGSVMRSRPEFHYRERTLTLPLVSFDGETGLTSRLRTTRGAEPKQQYPDPKNGFLNPPDSGSVTITVQSEYYEAWGRYFESDTRAFVSYDDPNERVTVTFLVLPDRNTFDGGFIATSSTGELALAAKDSYLNSYNSSAGNYSQTRSANGLIQSAGDYTGAGGSTIDGDVEAGGVVTLKGTAEINGNLKYGEKLVKSNNSDVTGTVSQGAEVRSVMPINTFVERYSHDVRTTNDNGETNVISNNQLSVAGSSEELDSGRYYLHDLTLESKTLVLDTTDGDVTVVVRDYAKLTKGGNLTVKGDGIARLVIAGESDTKVTAVGAGREYVNLHVGDGSDVHIPGEVSPNLRVYGTQDFNATIAGSQGQSKDTTFDGIIYAPAGTSGSGFVYVKHANLYGLAITGNLTVGKGGAAHYDYGLRGSARIQSPFSEIENLHVTLHQVRVTAGS